MEEWQAIARLKAGDISGLETLVHTYQRRAVGAALLITCDPDLAQDIVQTAFLRVYERIDQFHSGRPFGPWFLQSVVNDAKKATTRAKRHISLEEPAGSDGDNPKQLPAGAGGDPAILLERAETHAVVRAALQQLSLPQRTLIVQRYYLGFSEAEMAAAQACPPGTIKSRLHAGREHLRRLLSPLRITTAGSDSEE